MLAFAIAFGILQTGAPVSIPDERTELYRWFDTLPYAEMLKGSFAEISVSSSEHNGIRRGLFVSRKRKSFVLPDLTREALTRGAKYQALDFRTWIEEYLAEILGHERVILDRSGRLELPSSDIELFVLSYAAHARGLEDASHKLYTEAASGEHDTDGHDEQHEYASFGDWLKDNLATIEFGRLEARLRGGRLSRKDLIPGLESFVKCYRGTQAHAVARKTLETIRQMTADEKSHRPLDFGSASVREKVDEWLYQSISLESSGGQIPALPDFWETFRPAKIMAQMGYQVVPYLIDHLEDPRFTNTGESLHFGGSIESIYRVRDVALEILNHISAGGIVGNGDSPLSDEEASYSKSHARQWWAIASKQSESENIEAEIRSGTRLGVSLIPRLKRLAPSHVFPAVQEGLQRTSDPNACWELLRVLEQMGTPEAIRMIKLNLAEGMESWRRQSAGEVLLPKMPSLVASSLSNQLLETTKAGTTVTDFDAERLDYLLFRTGQGTAIRALSDHLSQYEASRRARIFLYLYGEPFAKGNAAYNWSKSPREIKYFQTEVERLLALELNDTEATGAPWFDRGIQNFSATRFCDWASLCLARLFPEKYWFQPYSSTKKRDYVRWLNYRTWEGG